MQSKYDRDLTGWYNLPLPRNIGVPRLFYARILLFTAVFGHFFFASKYRESFWEILRDSKFQNSKVILVRFRAFMTETFERHRSNQNRNTNWNEQNSERIQKIIFITVDFIKARVYNQKNKAVSADEDYKFCCFWTQQQSLQSYFFVGDKIIWNLKNMQQKRWWSLLDQ